MLLLDKLKLEVALVFRNFTRLTATDFEDNFLWLENKYRRETKSRNKSTSVEKT